MCADYSGPERRKELMSEARIARLEEEVHRVNQRLDSEFAEIKAIIHGGGGYEGLRILVDRLSELDLKEFEREIRMIQYKTTGFITCIVIVANYVSHFFK